LSFVLVGILVVATVSALSTGAFGVFTNTSVAAADINSGTVKLSWNQDGTTQLTTTVGPLKPGDSVQSISDLVNSGNTELSTIQIAIVGTDTGPVSDGLQIAIDSCSVPWTSTLNTFTCNGAGQTMRIVSTERPVTGIVNLLNSSAVTATGTDYLRFTYRLGDYAPASMANSSGVVTVVATGIQREGQTK
jgi:hypothetical protein